MTEEKSTRQRFTKPYHFLANSDGRPLRCLREIFRAFHLDDFRDELTMWKERALCNDKGSYDEASEREDLIDFCHECQKLTEAMFVLQKKAGKKKKPTWKKELSKAALAIIKRADQVELLSEEEEADPLLMIRHFCKLFTPAYAKTETLDWLEAVVTYEGAKQVYKGHVIFFYQCLEYLISHAFRLCKEKKQTFSAVSGWPISTLP